MGRGSIWEMILAAIVIVLIPVSVFVFFTTMWWLAFIPLGLIIVGMLVLIGGYIGGMIKDVERKENML
jgi:hypothetical protein